MIQVLLKQMEQQYCFMFFWLHEPTKYFNGTIDQNHFQAFNSPF